jgi:hypothetical protein
MDASKETGVDRSVGIVYNSMHGGLALSTRSPVRRLPLFVAAIDDNDAITMPDNVRDEITAYYTAHPLSIKEGGSIASTIRTIEKAWVKLKVEWVMPGTPYGITDYDGAETVVTPFEDYATIAVDPYDSMAVMGEDICYVVYDEDACEWNGWEYVSGNARQSHMAKRCTGRFDAADCAWDWTPVEKEDSDAKRACR